MSERISGYIIARLRELYNTLVIQNLISLQFHDMQLS